MTDDKGAAEFKLDLKRFVGRAYRLNVLGRAFEAEGGRNVAAQNSAIVSDAAYPGRRQAGRRLDVRAARQRAAGALAGREPATGSRRRRRLTLEWVQRKYRVGADAAGQRHAQVRVAPEGRSCATSRTVRIASGGSSLPLPTDEPGDFVLVLRDADGAELNTLELQRGRPGEPVALARSQCRAADSARQARATAAATRSRSASARPYVGAGLITIERERVFHVISGSRPPRRARCSASRCRRTSKATATSACSSSAIRRRTSCS